MRNLSAHHFIDSATEDVAARLNRLGGARAVLATVTSAKAMTPVIEGLAVRGRLIVVGVDAEPIEVSPLQLIGASRSVVGHSSGASIDSQDALAFSALSGVRPMIETMPLSRAPEAYARMMRAEARFRMVFDDGRPALAVSGPGDNSFRSCYSIDIPLAGSEAGLLLGAFRIKGAGRRFGTARCGSVLILPPMLAVNITKSN